MERDSAGVFESASKYEMYSLLTLSELVYSIYNNLVRMFAQEDNVIILLRLRVKLFK